jgi:hypothetical protein
MMVCTLLRFIWLFLLPNTSAFFGLEADRKLKVCVSEPQLIKALVLDEADCITIRKVGFEQEMKEINILSNGTSFIPS